MRARKDLERKKAVSPQDGAVLERRPVQVSSSPPARLEAGQPFGMIPYQVLIFLLTKTHTLHEVREFLDKRFNSA